MKNATLSHEQAKMAGCPELEGQIVQYDQIMPYATKNFLLAKHVYHHGKQIAALLPVTIPKYRSIDDPIEIS